MIPSQYIYLVGSLLSFIPWITFFYLRPDLRKQMLIVSSLFMIFAVVAEYFIWTVDYWHPETVTHTKIGIEDFILGFGNGGVAAVFYEVLFKRKFRKKGPEENLLTLLIVVTVLIILAILFMGLHFNSSVATPIAFFMGSLIILIKRADLIKTATTSAGILTITVTPIYLIMEFLSPGYIEKTWYFNQLSGITFLKVPLEDLVYYFFLVFFLAPIYSFWKNETLVSKK